MKSERSNTNNDPFGEDDVLPATLRRTMALTEALKRMLNHNGSVAEEKEKGDK